jgi:hypothetical protein
LSERGQVCQLSEKMGASDSLHHSLICPGNCGAAQQRISAPLILALLAIPIIRCDLP